MLDTPTEGHPCRKGKIVFENGCSRRITPSCFLKCFHISVLLSTEANVIIVTKIKLWNAVFALYFLTLTSTQLLQASRIPDLLQPSDEGHCFNLASCSRTISDCIVTESRAAKRIQRPRGKRER